MWALGVCDDDLANDIENYTHARYGMSTEMANNLTAVLLITRSRPGPRLVFHYPLKPSAHAYSTGRNTQECSDANSDSEPDDFDTVLKQPVNRGKPNVGHTEEPRNHRLSSGEESHDTFLGCSVESLEKLLSPGRWSDGKRFEVCVDHTTFIRHPVFAREDGSWSSKARRTSTQSSADQDNEDYVYPGSRDKDLGHTSGITIAAGESRVTATHDFTHISESLDSQAGTSLATSATSASTTVESPAEQLAMFNVVFALAEGTQRTNDAMYDHVAKTLSKALHYFQKQTGYVAKESRRLQSLKTKAKLEGLHDEALLSQMLESSELAWSLKQIFEMISTDRVAAFRLDGVQMSLQIPQSIENTESGGAVGKHSAILLLDEKDSMLRELAHPEATPLAYFIREHTPTKSLQKHAKLLDMAVDDVLFLAGHLVKWRKARVIAPLHPRNFYVVNTEADLGHLAERAADYSRRFPGLPPLPQMLKMLGGRPIRYGLLIPSRDHRELYMEILGYLVRHDFVVHLRTFGWLKAPAKHDHMVLKTGRAARELETARASLLSPHLRPTDDDALSVSSERTAIPLADAEHTATNELLDAPSELILDTSSLLDGSAPAVRIILDLVTYPELEEHLPSLLPHFDGEHAFEEIAALEGLKRARVDMWLDVLDQRGCLVKFQHP